MPVGSLKLPDSADSIKLPFNINLSSNSDSISSGTSEQSVCAFCGKQIAKYTCPQCNGQYCTATCFRSPAHAGCSSKFGEKQLTEVLQYAVKEQAEESDARRKQMSKILTAWREEIGQDEEALQKNFMDDNNRNDDSGHETDSDDDDIENKFDHLNLDAMTEKELWSKLSEKERAEFQVYARQEQPWWISGNDASEASDTSCFPVLPRTHSAERFQCNAGNIMFLMSVILLRMIDRSDIWPSLVYADSRRHHTAVDYTRIPFLSSDTSLLLPSDMDQIYTAFLASNPATASSSAATLFADAQILCRPHLVFAESNLANIFLDLALNAGSKSSRKILWYGSVVMDDFQRSASQLQNLAGNDVITSSSRSVKQEIKIP